MRFNVELKGDKELEKEIGRIISKEQEVKQEVLASALDIRNKAMSNLKGQSAVDTGNLRNSILAEMDPSGREAEIGPQAPYGPYVEYGTRPHFPPPDALEHWARHHGFDSAWPICKIIATRGLRARPYLFPAYLSLKNEFFERIRRIFER